MPLRRGWAFALMAALMLSHAPPLCISSSNMIKSDGSITSSLPYLEELEALIQTRKTINVSITPLLLVIKASEICSPMVGQFVVKNLAESGSIVIESCKSDRNQFRPSKFPKKTLQPGESLTISVTFLAHQVGSVIGTLTIQTSKGKLTLEVTGHAWYSTFSMEPRVGIKVRVGENYKTSFEIRNPFEHPLRVHEIYTNEGFLHLMLPKKCSSTSKDNESLWEIRPMSKKKVINLIFDSTSVGTHVGMVHMRTSAGNFIVPVEIHVVPLSLAVWPEMLDFGILTSPTSTKILDIMFLQGYFNLVSLIDARPQQSEPSLKIVIKKHSLAGLKTNAEYLLAQVTFSGKTEGDFQGKIILEANKTDSTLYVMQVNYRARVVHGYLDHDKQNTSFIMRQDLQYPLVHHLTLTNMFKVPIYIISVLIRGSFLECDFHGGETLLKPKQSSSTIRISLTNTSDPFIGELVVFTSLMTFRIPLPVYHGKLDLSESDRNDGFGVIAINQTSRKVIKIYNRNPAPITVLEVQVDQHPSYELSIETSDYIESPTCLYFANMSEYGKKGSKSNNGNLMFSVERADYIQIHVSVYSKAVESVHGSLILRTKYEVLNISLDYRSIEGNIYIYPNPLYFETCSSSQIRTQTLVAVNTFPSTVRILSAEASDPRLELTVRESNLEPSLPMISGFVILDVDNSLWGDTYLMWANRKILFASRGSFVDDIDIAEHNWMHERWDEVVKTSGTELKMHITFNFNVSMKVKIPVIGSISLPDFLDRNIFFGTVYVGSWSTVNHSLENPSSLTTFFKVVLPNASIEPTAQGFDICQTERACFMESDFLIPATFMSGIVIGRRSGVNITNMIFAPKRAGKFKSKLYLRNNLTALVEFTLYGVAEEPSLVVTGEGSKACTLSRNVPASNCRFHLPCHDNQTSGTTESDGTSSFLRTFKISNPSRLPIVISSVSFDGVTCSSRGLSLQDCQGSKEVNQTHPLDMRIKGKLSYCEQPVLHTLVIHTHVGKFQFELLNREHATDLVMEDALKYLTSSPAHYSHCLIAGVSMSILILAFTFQVKHKSRLRGNPNLRQIKVPSIPADSRSYFYETELHIKFLQNRKRSVESPEVTIKAEEEKLPVPVGKMVGKGKAAKSGGPAGEGVYINGTPKGKLEEEEKGPLSAKSMDEDRGQEQADRLGPQQAEGRREKTEEGEGEGLQRGEQEEIKVPGKEEELAVPSEGYQIFIPKAVGLIPGAFGSLEEGKEKTESFGVLAPQEPLGGNGREMLNPDFPLDELQQEMFASQDFEDGDMGPQGVMWEPMAPPTTSLLPDANASGGFSLFPGLGSPFAQPPLQTSSSATWTASGIALFNQPAIFQDVGYLGGVAGPLPRQAEEEGKEESSEAGREEKDFDFIFPFPSLEPDPHKDFRF